MGSTFFSDLYDEAEKGVARAAVPKGVYDFVVTEARPYAQSSMIFLTFTVLNGPQKGKQSEVNIVFPSNDAKRGARFYFVNRVQGFLAYPDVKNAFQTADKAPEFADGLELIADTIKGKQVVGEVNLVETGQYAGSNELLSTKPPAGLTPPQQQIASPTVTEPTATPTPAPGVQPFPNLQLFPNPGSGPGF